jgi:NAD(P)-dependent dehydrogenase (short-subunit alcohol dehydrogenase family)
VAPAVKTSVSLCDLLCSKLVRALAYLKVSSAVVPLLPWQGRRALAGKAGQMGESMRTVLITGCSSGIGRASALMLAEKGFRVLAGVRSAEQVERLTDPSLPGLEPIQLDVTSEDDVRQVVEHIRQTCPQGLCALVNNAGMGLPAAVELSTIDEVRQLLEVNTVGPLRLIQSCLPMLRVGRGRIINMSSTNGALAMPMVGAYSASKFALEALSDALRVELRPWRIPVIIIRPGQVRTPIFSKMRDNLKARSPGIPAELKQGYDAMYARAGQFNERGAKSPTSPEAVARAVCRAIEAKRPRTHYLVGIDARGLQLAKLLVPQRLLDRIFARIMRVFKPIDSVNVVDEGNAAAGVPSTTGVPGVDGVPAVTEAEPTVASQQS